MNPNGKAPKRTKRKRPQTARDNAGLTTPDGYTDSEKFAPLAARAAKGQTTIGATPKAKT